ncbi:MAG: CapA family protein, partial [Desulfuromonadales bacterium]|nr:CapA family protein [Desulfuromonadales bacterium]
MEQLSVLSAVGDINLGDRAMMIGLGVRSRISQDPNYDPFQGVRQLLTESDLSFGNLECVISDSGLDDNRNDSRMMRAAPETLHLLKKGGFNLLSVANNHIMQH